MMIPSAPAVPVASSMPAGASAVGAKGSSATPTGPFDSLLPKDTSSESGSGKGGKSFPAEESAKPDDGANVSIQALQANLAAMLHAIPVVQTPVATTPSLTAAASNVAVDPTTSGVDAAAAAATASLGGVPSSLVSASPAAATATGATLPNPATTVQDPTQTAAKPAAGGHHGGGHGGGVRALRKVQEEEEVTAVKKTTAAAQPEETAEVEDEAPAAAPQATPFDALLKTPAEAATAAMAENPALAGETDPDGSSKNESEEAAEIAALDKPAENLPETDAAIPARPTPSTVPIASSRMIFQSTAKPDAALVSEEMAAVKKMHGTAGAKGERDMNSVSTKPQNSSPRTTAAQPGETSSVTAKPGAGDDAHGQKQSGRQDAASADHTRAELDKTDNTFSAAVQVDNFSVSRPVTASTSAEATTAAKSTSASSILDEVGMGLERIQQGTNRLDLHVALEGGGHVNIELQLRDGAVHASFLTTSTELRNALQQGWSQMTSRSESLGLQMADPTFKTPPTPTPTNSFSSFTQTGQQDSRGQRQAPQSEQPAGSTFTSSFTQTKPSGTAKAPTRSLNSGLNEWA